MSRQCNIHDQTLHNPMACSSLHVQSSPTGFQLIPQYVAAHCHCQGGQPVTFAPFVDDCVLEHQLIAVAPNLLPCPRVSQSMKRFILRFAYETTPYSCNVFVKDLVTGVAVFAISDGSTVFFDHPLGKISFNFIQGRSIDRQLKLTSISQFEMVVKGSLNSV